MVVTLQSKFPDNWGGDPTVNGGDPTVKFPDNWGGDPTVNGGNPTVKVS